MKTIPQKIPMSYRRKLLTISITAISSMMLANSVSNASDIEIYQQAKSGTVTLMFMLDISGSMSRYNGNTLGYACDLPSGVSDLGRDKATEAPIVGGPSYERAWCRAVGSNRIYKFRSYKQSSGGWFPTTTTYYQTCTTPQANYDNCTWTTANTTAPQGIWGNNIFNISVGSYTYYYTAEEERFYDRITRLKDGMIDLLYGNPSKGIVRISDDKVIGLSTLGATSGSSYVNTGAVLVPARRLDAIIGSGNSAKTQRQILIDTIKSFSIWTNTPTARSFAETVAYLMGSTTDLNKEEYFGGVYQGRNIYSKCNTLAANGQCASWGDLFYGNVPTGYTRGRSISIGSYAGNVYTSGRAESGFPYSAETTKNSDNTLYISPSSLTQNDEVAKCSGQGVYVLTDGEPTQDTNSLSLIQTALGSKGSSFSCSGDSYDCVHNLSKTLLDPKKNPAGLEFKTAVVGFGGEFSDLASYDPNKSYEENIAPFVDKNGNMKSGLNYVQKAAYWGILGRGGWYSGSSSQDVVDSVNNFINSLTTTIPAVTTGSPTIPKDALNPAVLQDDAYYQQFQPTPDRTYQLWTGNLKKYLVTAGGVLKGKDNNKIVDNDGKIINNYDYWAYPIDNGKKDADDETPGSIKFALRGGAWSRLLLRTDPVNNPTTGTVQRKVLTNRVYLSGSGGNSAFGENNSYTLRRVLPTDLTDTNYKNDPNRGYLVRLLGYNIDAATPPNNIDVLKTAAEFRQMGAVMHSSPILITNKGKLEFDTSTKTISSSGREDYVLFGTTQGILHVVKAGKSGVAGGGEEIFSFVPNEMIERQKQAFEKPEATNGGINNLYYGIDGPWTAYTEYVVDSSGNLTVGNGKSNQKGVQDVYGGLRMGGKSYYALDLRDINNPKLKFHIDPSGTCSDSNPLGCMGQSWSKPSIGFVNWGGKRTRVMFVGGGYDMGYEVTNYVQTNKVGAGVYMFRAEDEVSPGNGKAGELLWWSSANAKDKATMPVAKKYDDLKYSVVSEIRTVDRDGDNLIDHIYFGDLGGQIFRIDFDNKQNAIENLVKQPVRIFNGNKASGKSPRFYDMPAFSLYSDNGSIFAVISQGSGNRSKPLFADTSYDYDAIYNIYDKDVARKNLYSATSWTTKDIKPDNLLGLRLLNDEDRKNDSNLKAPASTNGWYYEFTVCVKGYGKCDDYTKQTEKVFGTPVALNKKLFVSTFDASKDGLAGDCGAGVKGASLMTTFCMPFGQCKTTDVTGTTHSMIGAGIHTIAVGNDVSNGEGGNGGGGNGGGSGNNNEDSKSSASNYCISTGGRMAITVTGGASTGEQTRMCLIPQRWYEKVQ